MLRDRFLGPGIMAAAALVILFAGHVFAQVPPGPIPAPGIGNYGPPFTTKNGHAGYGGSPPPTISACGTGPLGAFGSDAAFYFQSGVGASGVCTVTPASPYAARPICSVDGESATPPAFNITNTGVLNFTSGLQDSTRYYVVCFAQPGGF